MIITGAIDTQYFGMSRSFDRGTELKSGFVAEVIPFCTFFHELLQSYFSITPTTLLILHSFLGHRLLLSKITRSNNQQAIRYSVNFRR